MEYKLQFENGVISYGSQAMMISRYKQARFENGVISYGSQAGKIKGPSC